ncbi:MAG TPA: energy transducer TonB [Gammaproteobacteria bacterium]|nr:energy transducer TonB [Gammaproteobacteria bacterium]
MHRAGEAPAGAGTCTMGGLHGLSGVDTGVNALAGNPGRDRRLGRFLLLSIALHASLLLAVLGPVQLSLPAARDAGPLAVRLRTAPAHRHRDRAPAKTQASGHRTAQAPPPASSRASTARAATTRAAVHRHVAQRTPGPSSGPVAHTHEPRRDAAAKARSSGASKPKEKAAARQPRRQPQRSAKAGPGPSTQARQDTAGGTSASAARSRVVAQVRRNLRRYFHYPGIAQRRGWEGRVVLDFAVRGDGRISDIRVAHSSGHAVLDHSAVQALRRIGRLDVGGAWPAGGLHNVKLPVIYRLEG